MNNIFKGKPIYVVFEHSLINIPNHKDSDQILIGVFENYPEHYFPNQYVLLRLYYETMKNHLLNFFKLDFKPVIH